MRHLLRLRSLVRRRARRHGGFARLLRASPLLRRRGVTRHARLEVGVRQPRGHRARVPAQALAHQVLLPPLLLRGARFEVPRHGGPYARRRPRRRGRAAPAPRRELQTQRRLELPQLRISRLEMQAQRLRLRLRARARIAAVFAARARRRAPHSRRDAKPPPSPPAPPRAPPRAAPLSPRRRAGAPPRAHPPVRGGEARLLGRPPHLLGRPRALRLLLLLAQHARPRLGARGLLGELALQLLRRRLGGEAVRLQLLALLRALRLLLRLPRAYLRVRGVLAGRAVHLERLRQGVHAHAWGLEGGGKRRARREQPRQRLGANLQVVRVRRPSWSSKDTPFSSNDARSRSSRVAGSTPASMHTCRDRGEVRYLLRAARSAAAFHVTPDVPPGLAAGGTATAGAPPLLLQNLESHLGVGRVPYLASAEVVAEAMTRVR